MILFDNNSEYHKIIQSAYLEHKHPVHNISNISTVSNPQGLREPKQGQRSGGEGARMTYRTQDDIRGDKETAGLIREEDHG